jgi:hypothetical protein
LLHREGKKKKSKPARKKRLGRMKTTDIQTRDAGGGWFVLERTMVDGSDEIRWMSSGWYSGDLTRMRKNECGGNEWIESGVGDSTQD